MTDYDAFISYANADAEWVHPLAENLDRTTHASSHDNRGGILGHRIGDGSIERIVAFRFQELGEIAVREDAGQLPIMTGQDERTGSSTGTARHDEHVANRMRLASNSAFG